MLIMRMDLVNAISVSNEDGFNERRSPMFDDASYKKTELNTKDNRKLTFLDEYTSFIVRRYVHLNVPETPNGICNNRFQPFHNTEEPNVIDSVIDSETRQMHESKVSPPLCRNSTKSTLYNELNKLETKCEVELFNESSRNKKLNRIVKVSVEKLPEHLVDNYLTHKNSIKLNEQLHELNTSDSCSTNINNNHNKEPHRLIKPCYVHLNRLPIESTICNTSKRKHDSQSQVTLHNFLSDNDELQQATSSEVPLIRPKQNSFKKFLPVSQDNICVNSVNKNLPSKNNNFENFNKRSPTDTCVSNSAVPDEINKPENEDNQNLSQQMPDCLSRHSLLRNLDDVSCAKSVLQEIDTDNQKSRKTRHNRSRKILFDKLDSVYFTTNNSFRKVKTSHSRASTVDKTDNQKLPRNLGLLSHKKIRSKASVTNSSDKRTTRSRTKISAAGRHSKGSRQTTISRILVNQSRRNKNRSNATENRHRKGSSKKWLTLRNKVTNRLISNSKASKIQEPIKRNKHANRRKSLSTKTSSQNDLKSTNKLGKKTTENQHEMLKNKWITQNSQVETQLPRETNKIGDSDLTGSSSILKQVKLQTDQVNTSDNKENSRLVQSTSLHFGKQLAVHRPTEGVHNSIKCHSQSKKNTPLRNPVQSLSAIELMFKTPGSNTGINMKSPTELPSITQNKYPEHSKLQKNRRGRQKKTEYNDLLTYPTSQGSFPLIDLNDEIKSEPQNSFDSCFIVNCTATEYQPERNCDKLLKTTLRNQFERNMPCGKGICPQLKIRRQYKKRQDYLNQFERNWSCNASKQRHKKQDRFQPQTLAALAVQTFFGSKMQL